MKSVIWFLVIASAIRVGIIGFFGTDLIGAIFGSEPVYFSWADRVISAIVGLSGLYAVYLLFTRRSDREVVYK